MSEYKFPIGFLESLKHVDGWDEDAFIQAHLQTSSVSVRINPKKFIEQFSDYEKVPWCNQAFYLSERISFTHDPLWHAGTYYVQEASSMVLDFILRNMIDLNSNLKILDVCAAPGGKSTLIASLINDKSILISNEVVRSRMHTLEENIVKWGNANVMIINSDTSKFKHLQEYFDVIVADAPCSGSGLFRKDTNAMEEWSMQAVQMCSKRQQDILQDILPALKQGGLLIYSTCSFSKEENEDIIQMLLSQYSLEKVQLSFPDNWGIITNNYGARFYPDKLKGEGFFISVLRKGKRNNQEFKTIYQNKPSQFVHASSNEKDFFYKVSPLFKNGKILKRKAQFYFMEDVVWEAITALENDINIKHAGLELGEIKGEDFIPAHALALHPVFNKHFSNIEIDKSVAIQYLKKLDVSSCTSFTEKQKGWHILKYKNHALGWIKVLPTRINNYYPAEYRIKK